MENVIIISLLITFLYCCVKFVEMKFINKEWLPLKHLVRDSLILFSCSVVSTYFYFYLEPNVNEFFNVVTDNKLIAPTNTQIFTDDPGF